MAQSSESLLGGRFHAEGDNFHDGIRPKWTGRPLRKGLKRSVFFVDLKDLDASFPFSFSSRGRLERVSNVFMSDGVHPTVHSS